MAAITGAVLAAGTAGYQVYNSEKQKSDAKKSIANFRRQELVNHAENIQISTLKSEQQTEANQVNLATSIDALQRGGTRTVLGGLPVLNSQNIQLQNLISQDLENQDLNRQKLILQQQNIIDGVREGRETGALAGLHNSLDEAKQNQATAIGNAFSSLTALDSAIKSKKGNTNNVKSSKFTTPRQERKLFDSFNKTENGTPIGNEQITFNADLSTQDVNDLSGIFF